MSATNPDKKFQLQLDFFDVKELNSTEYLTAEDPIARHTLNILMMGWHNDQDVWNKLQSRQVFNALFWAHDKQLTNAMRRKFQCGFNNIFNQLKYLPKPQLPDDLEQCQLYISNCLSLFPFSELNPYEQYKIPQYINGEWQLITYKVEPIELTKKCVTNTDRVFAYGLTPKEGTDFANVAKRHLLFLGTTYPAGQGHTKQVYSDLLPGQTPGWDLFQSGRKNILEWLDKIPDNKPQVCGMSLGGALSLLIACEYPERLSRVDALNPPGLIRSIFNGKWEAATEKPKVVIQKQGNDWVSKFGWWKPDWIIHEITPPADKKGPNRFYDHALNYAGMKDSNIKTKTGRDDNWSFDRILGNIILYHLGRWLLSGLLKPMFMLAWIGHIVYDNLYEITALTLIATVVALTAPVSLPLLITATLATCCLFIFCKNFSAIMGLEDTKPLESHMENNADLLLKDLPMISA